MEIHKVEIEEVIVNKMEKGQLEVKEQVLRMEKEEMEVNQILQA